MTFIEPSWPAPKNIKSYTTCRTGWTKRADPIDSLFAVPHQPIWLKQVHGTTVVTAPIENKEVIADACYTTEKARICAVLTADCVPILICNHSATAVAAIHAGWRGLSAGVIENTVHAMQQPVDELMAWLGPAIGPTKFEVGNDVYETFCQQNADAASAFTQHGEDKWLANLYALATFRLQALGISQIYGGEYCTYSQEDLFFSYRRDGKDTGRMASLIWME